MAENKLAIEVSVDASKARSELDSVGNKVNEVGNKMGAAGAQGSSFLGGLINPATLAVGAVAGLGAALFDTVGKAGEFDQKMAAINATMNPTAEQFKQLNDLALQLGAATDVGSVSAADAADAIGVLGKAGVSAQDQLAGVTHSVLQLSAAAGPEFGVANAAELAADSLNSFGLNASDATGVVNTLVGAANASSIGLSDLKFGLAATGSVAHTMGMSFNDTTTALALFGASGLKGSDAGTSLKTMLMNLIPHSESAAAEMEKLGLITKDGSNAFFDAQGHIKSLTDVAGTLQTALAGMSDEERVAALNVMFGSDAIRAGAILADKGAAGVDKMSAAMVQQGDAAKVAGDMSNNFKSKMEALGGTVETAQITIGQHLTPVLGQLADAANNLIGGAIVALPGIIQTASDAMGAFGSFVQANAIPIMAGLGTLVVTVVIPAFVAWAAAAGAAALATITALAPILIPIAAVIAAVALLKAAWDNNFLGIRDTLMPIVQQITAALSTFWTEIQPQLITAWNTIQTAVSTAITFVGNIINTVMTTVTTAWNSNWGGIQTIVTTVWNIIQGVVQTAWTLVSGIITAGVQVLKGDWSGAWTTIQNTLKGVWDTVTTVILPNALNLIITLVTNFIPTAIGKLGELGGAFLGWVDKDVIPFLGAKLGEIATALWTWITTTAGDAVKAAGEIGSSIISGIVSALAAGAQAIINKILEIAGGALDAIKNFFGIGGSSSTPSSPPSSPPASPPPSQPPRGHGRTVTGGGTSGGFVGAFAGEGGAGSGEVIVNVYLDSKLVSQTLASRQVSRQVLPSVRVVRSGA